MRSLTEDLAVGAGASREFRKLERAVRKAGGDRERALRNVARLLCTHDLPARFVRLVDGLLAAEVRR
jgi:hypothetical protein